MKMCVLIIVLMSLFLPVKSQVINEWLRQKATQRKYLIQQIIALQAQIAQLKKGFDIAKKGYGAIQSIKNGELSLHTLFLSELKIVNPKIKKYARVADIISNQITVLKVCKENIRKVRSTGMFRPSEISAITDVTTTLFRETAQTIDQLASVILNGRYEMTDGERLVRIDRLYADSKKQVETSLTLSQQVSFVNQNRLQQFSDAASMRNLYALE